MDREVCFECGHEKWGVQSLINLYNCDGAMIRDSNAIKRYIVELCRLIEMERKGEVDIDRFGSGIYEGFSAKQFIEFSLIAVHFDEICNRAFIDIFSCKEYDTEKAKEFSQKYFKAENSIIKVIERS